MDDKPNILLILNDDMGFSDLGCYGGEIQTPHLNSLAAGGLRYTQFYNTARCCPSRASLLTGLYPHQADVGHMLGDDGIDGYLGDLNKNTVTIAEALRQGGYRTYMSGKWHVTRHLEGPKHNWPNQRGFDDFYGIITGAANYYQPQTLTRNNEHIYPDENEYFLTDAITEEAIRQLTVHQSTHNNKPFFQYVAYTAPHWPLHAHEEDIAKYKGRFDSGWDVLRKQRIKRMVKMGLIDEQWLLSDRDPRVGAWVDENHKEWQSRRMEVYAAQIDRMDQGIGRILNTLEQNGTLENTCIMFLSDNGGCAEELDRNTETWIADGPDKAGTLKTKKGLPVRFGNDPDIFPGKEDTYASYGIPWANLSNTPFRLYKHWVHEGGIATPLIIHWPRGIKDKGKLRHQPGQLPDILATFLDIADIDYPSNYHDKTIRSLEGISMVPTFTNEDSKRKVLYWEHEGNKAVRKEKWKQVCKYPGNWELYDMETGRTELNDISGSHPDIVRELENLYNKWSKKCNILPWDEVIKLKSRGKRSPEIDLFQQ